MRENICTIPINEVFSEKSGCPFCSIYQRLEEQCVSFIVGDAMMEPSIRVEVNKQGFCSRHFEQMYNTGSRLPVALMLETHLEYLAENALNSKAAARAENIEEIVGDCFICRRVNKSFSLYIDTVIEHWRRDEEFRTLYSQQEYICARHCAEVLRKCDSIRAFSFKGKKEFCKQTVSLSADWLDALRKDISRFCEMYDYRRRGEDFSSSLDAIEKSLRYLK